MITSADQYLFVLFPPGVQVDGDVMPVRADRTLLRCVDVGFLVEGARERYSVATRNISSAVDLSSAIKSDQLDYIPGWLDTFVSYYAVREDSVLSFKETTGLSSTHPKYAFPDDFLSSSDISSSKAAFDNGMPLSSSEVMKVFSDLGKIRRLTPTFSLSDVSAGFSLMSSGTASEQYPETGTIYYWYGQTARRTGATSFRAYSPSPSSYLAITPSVPGLVSGCRQVLFALEVYYRDSDAGVSFTKTCICPVVPSKSGDAYVVDYTAIMDMISTSRIYLGASGNKYPAMSTTINTFNRVYVRIRGIYPVLDLTDHTKIG